MKKILSLFISFIALSSIMIGSETKAAAAAAPLLEDMALTVPMALNTPWASKAFSSISCG